MKAKRRLSHKTSILMLEPILPFPTLEEIPSRGAILSIPEIDEKLSQVPMDIYAMFQLVLEIKANIEGLQYSVSESRAFGLRLNALIRLIFGNFGVEGHHYKRLIASLRINMGQWKQALLTELATEPISDRQFIFKAERNIYLGEVLTTLNLLLQKTLQKVGDLNLKHKAYLRQHGMLQACQKVWITMKHLLSQQQEETILKVEMLRQCAKYLLLAFTLSQSGQKQRCLLRFMEVTKAICRIICKFNGKISSKIKQSVLLVFARGLNVYSSFYQKRQPHKATQAQLILQVFRPAQQRVQLKKLRSPNAPTLRFIQRVLRNWKRVKSTEHSQNKQSVLDEKAERELEETMKLNRRNQLQTGSRVQIRGQIYRLRRAQSACHRTRTSNSHLSTYPKSVFPKQPTLNQLPVRQKDIPRPKTATFFRQRSLLRSRSQYQLAPRKDQGVQLHLQDYIPYINKYQKTVPTLNRIKLYKADRMQGYCARRQKKLKITG